MEFSVEKKVNGTTTLLYLKGMLDITTTHLVNPYLDELDKDIKVLIIDFSLLDFLDSTGIGSLIDAIYLSQSKGFVLKFQGVSELVDQVFNMIGVYKILETIQGEVV